MINLKPYSASLAALGGFLLCAIGVYFAFMRPGLLPEDIRYMQTDMQTINGATPYLTVWLQKVFWVMGGYIFTSGLLTIFISLTAFRTRSPWAFYILALAGMSSIGLMTVINFIIGSDFKWMLLLFTMPWAIALILYQAGK